MLNRRVLLAAAAITATSRPSTGAPRPVDTIFEFRDYTLQPGQREVMIDLFERLFVDSLAAAGANVRAIFRDIDRPDHFVWIRSFASMVSRRAALEAFYDGPVWQANRDAARATMIDTDDVRLLRADQDLPPPGALEAPLVIADILPEVSPAQLAAALDGRSDVIALFRTEASENTYPRLPVRAGQVVVMLRKAADFGPAERIATLPAPLATYRLRPTARSPLALSGFVQSPRDFDFLAGEWRVRHRRLRVRNAGCKDWDIYEGASRFQILLGGVANVDENVFPQGRAGLTFRTLDQETGTWSIYWLTAAQGVLLPPVHGGFIGETGAFLGADTDGPHPILCRFHWRRDPAAPHWEQAFSYDGGQTWETNWTMDFVHA